MSTSVLELRLFSPGGVEFGRVSDFEWVGCTTRVNGPGFLQCQLRGDHDALSELEHRGLVELWRKDGAHGVDWYRHFSGIYMDQDRSLFEVPTAVIRAPGDLHMLRRRIVNWAAGTLNRSKFISDPAETVMKLLVQYNCTGDATVANGRKRDGDNWPGSVVSIETDVGGGNVLDWYCHGAVLLETLQELALAAGGDFELFKSSSSSWEFRFHAGQLGEDRTGSVTFALQFDNVGEPRFRLDRLGEGTVACVWGQGEGVAREYVTREGPDFSSENDIEFYVNATDIEFGNTAGLEARGDVALEEKRARAVSSFRALVTEGTMFQRDFGLGDLVKAVNAFTGEVTTPQVVAVHLGLDGEGVETVEAELR